MVAITKRRANFLISGRERLNIQQLYPVQLYYTCCDRSDRVGKACTVSPTDEEMADTRSVDGVPGLGANSIDAQDQECTRARRFLRAHRQDRKGRTGLFDEMRQSA